MTHQPLFVFTSKGYINLALVRLVLEDKDHVRFVFDDKEHIDLPLKEGGRVLSIMVGELFVYPE
jgi:hypothetical protein